MIPKKIHYCWFGNNKKSKLIKKCIKSWKKFCPDYEIIEWNESNFDIECNTYVKQAYEQKKWAFVADYARFYVLNKFGGVYLDTDVQLLRSIDELVDKGKFAGFASDSIVCTGLILVADKNDWLCEEVLNSYKGECFVWEDPSKILAIGRRVTDILEKHGLQANGELQEIEGYTIYPKYYFNPTDGDIVGKIDKRAYSVHHYAATWFLKKLKFKNTVRHFIGHKNMEKLKKIKAFFK